MASPQLIEASPENAVATDERIRADLARLLQERLVHESTLGVWVHPILIAVVLALAWPDAPHDLLLGWGGAVLFTALVRGLWIYLSPRRRLTERVVRSGRRRGHLRAVHGDCGAARAHHAGRSPPGHGATGRQRRRREARGSGDARGPRPRRARRPRAVGLPRQHEPRDSHADERRARL